MVEIKLEIPQLKQFQRALRQFPQEMGRRAGQAIRLALEEWRNETAQYPPQTAGNQPKSYQPGRWNTWYVRGFGSRWARADGSVGERASSEQLGRSWFTKVVSTTPPVLSGEMAPRASYAHWVQDPARQTGVHAGHGWQTIEQTGNKAKPKMQRIFEQMVQRALAWVARQVGG